MKIEERNGKLTIVDFNELEAYKIACKVERDGISFYKKLKEKVDKPQVKEILDFLIGEEQKHLKFFEDCIYEVRRREEDYFEEDDLLSYMDFGVFQPYKNIEELENIISDIDAALRLGIAIENKSINFYTLCKTNISSPSAKEGLENIIKEELRHKELMESIIKKI